MAATGGGSFPNAKATSKGEVLLYHILQQLGAMGGGGGGLATEATLLGVLTAIDSMRDYEVRLVVDSDAPNVTWLEVRYWDAQSGALGAPVYYAPGSTVAGAPVLPITYINPNTYLAQIVSNTSVTSLEATQLLVKGVLDAINSKTITDDDDNVIAEGQTLPLIIAELYGNWDGAWQRITTDGNNNLGVAVNSSVLPTGAATETTVSTLATPVTGLATSLTRVVGAGAANVAAGKRRVSFFNAGNADASVAGGTLEKGESVTFSADGLRDVLAAISYDALTSELVITTVG